MKSFILAAWVATALLAQTSQTPTEPPPGSISGTVTDTTGAPVSDLPVAVSRSATTTTDSQGHYSLKGLKPGPYTVVAGSPMEGKASPVFRSLRLEPGQDLKLDLQVQLYAAVTGKVLDENKEPVPDVTVILAMREYVLGAVRYRYGVFGGKTDDRGMYTIHNISPGRSYVAMAGHRLDKLDAVSNLPADPKMRKPVVMRTYYPDSPTFDGAEVLVLRPGERRDGVDIRLRKSPSFCIDGVLEAGGKPGVLSFSIIEPGPTSGARAGGGGSYVVEPGGKTGADGKFRVCDLYPGIYHIRASQAPSAQGGAPAFYGTAEVTIKDEDVHNLRVAAPAMLTVTGEVVWDGPAPDKPVNAKIRLYIRPMTRAPWMDEAQGLNPEVTIPGEFTLPNMFVDEYAVTVFQVPPALYIKDITYGNASVFHEPMRVGSGLGGTLRVIIGRDGGTIGVKVADKDGNPVPDINVYVMPASIPSEALLYDMMTRGQTDQAGSYTSATLAPGKYHVIASATRIDASPETIARFWRARTRGTEVEVGKNAAAQITVTPVAID